MRRAVALPRRRPVVPWPKAGVGALATQAAGVAAYSPRILALLEDGLGRDVARASALALLLELFTSSTRSPFRRCELFHSSGPLSVEETTYLGMLLNLSANLRHIFQKMNVSSRVALARAVERADQAAKADTG